MRKNKKTFVVIGSALLFVIGVTVLFAAVTSWSGTGTGYCTFGERTIYPFYTWVGDLDDVSNTFEGSWDDGTYTGTFEGILDPSDDSCHCVWKCDQVEVDPEQSTDDILGGMHGLFDFQSRTVDGEWDTDSVSSCDGDWEGEED